jgi:hypothetical protein
VNECDEFVGFVTSERFIFVCAARHGSALPCLLEEVFGVEAEHFGQSVTVT